VNGCFLVDPTTHWRGHEGRLRDGEGTYAGMRGNDGIAPIAAVRRTTIEPPESTHSGRSHPSLAMPGGPCPVRSLPQS
jgi:hypothetical protein